MNEKYEYIDGNIREYTVGTEVARYALRGNDVGGTYL